MTFNSRVLSFQGFSTKSAAPHCLNRNANGAPARHGNNGQRLVHLAQRRDQRQAFLAGNGVFNIVEIDQRQLAAISSQRGQRLLRRVAGNTRHAFALSQERERVQNIFIVVDD